MQTSQTLTNLANSAKASQEEFNNTLIEIHKQSVLTIEEELAKIYKNEIEEIRNDTRKEISQIANEIHQVKKTMLSEMKLDIIERLWRGTTLTILIIGLIIGFFIAYKIYSNQISNYQTQINMLLIENQSLTKWQIPENLKTIIPDKITKKESRYIILPEYTHKLKDGTKLYQIYNGGL